jgi:hypothetical protein
MGDPMDVDALIEVYIREVVQLLPRRQRQDVALELRGLVHEELQGRATSQRRTLDANIALDGLRAFGKPQDVAARYYEPWIIIAPTETRRFTFAALIGALVLMALSPLIAAPARSGQLALLMLAWLGALVSYFAIRSFIARRRTGGNLWVPRENDRVSRTGSVAIIAMICIGIAAYGAPGWLFSRFSHGQLLPALLAYDPAFQSTRLPVLFFLWVCQAVLLAVLFVRGRWNPVLRRVDVSLEIAVGLVLVWFQGAGSVFKDVASNKVALSAISAVALLLFIDAGVKLYRGVNRIPSPDEFRSETS